jgi:hypothetical protein
MTVKVLYSFHISLRFLKKIKILLVCLLRRYLGATSLVERRLHQLVGKHVVLVNAYFIIKYLLHFLMYGILVTNNGLSHASALDFGDRFHKHLMLATIGINE